MAFGYSSDSQSIVIMCLVHLNQVCSQLDGQNAVWDYGYF